MSSLSARPTLDEIADFVERNAILTATALRRAAVVEVSSPPPCNTGLLWRQRGELPNQSYAWPKLVEKYDPFEVWEGGLHGPQIGIGNPNMLSPSYGGRHRYLLAFEMINGKKRRPIAVFIEAEDGTGDLVSPIKGKGKGGRSMFSPGDELPQGYADFAVETFRDRIPGPQAFNRLSVIAPAGDRQTICTHAFLQLRLR